MDNTAKGNIFRSHVLALLRTKYSDASTEVLTSWKKADIVFTGMDFGRRIRFAVECKNYHRKLTTTDFSKIAADYDAAFAAHEIHTLIIISLHDIEAASRRFVEDSPRIRFMTFTELEEWLIGLRGYIEHLSKAFVTDDVHDYYIDGRFTDYPKPAFEVLREWIDLGLSNGLAVLGGYGLGKSSLAKRLAADQAARYLANPSQERMPILLKLGQVVHETELSGLFGKEFTAEHFVDGYSFKTLMHLNEQGRLLVILDGFDEMKHAMTEADFRSNFREFNKLRTEKAKVLLLGRPSAFTSESADLLIKGLSRMGGQTYVDGDFPPWLEHTLAFFSQEEAKTFLLRFLAHSARKKEEQPDLPAIEMRVAEILQDVLDEILQRPVQAKIVGQLAASPNYSFKNINRFKLYNDFVERMIERDQEKRARKLIPHQSRRLFLEELAWWAWARGSTAQGVFRKDEVPTMIFEQLPDGQAVDIKSKRSEYLVSSLTEQKDSDVLYFAHRSFQEFLVAARISSMTSPDQELLPMISKALSPEIVSFLCEVEENRYLDHLHSLLGQRTRSEISISLLLLMRLNRTVVDAVAARSPLELTIYDVIVAGFPDKTVAPCPLPQHVEWLLDVIRNSPIAVADAAFWCLLRHPGDAELLHRTIAAVWERVLTGVQPDAFTYDAAIVDQQHFGTMADVLRTVFSKVRNLQSRRIGGDLDQAVNMMTNSMTRAGLIVPPLTPENQGMSGYEFVDGVLIESFLPKNAAKLFAKVYALKTDKLNLVRKTEKGRSSARLG